MIRIKSIGQYTKDSITGKDHRHFFIQYTNNEKAMFKNRTVNQTLNQSSVDYYPQWFSVSSPLFKLELIYE